MKTLESTRLHLRAWQYADLHAFHAYAKDPELGWMAGWKPHESLDESRKILQHFIDGKACWCIRLKETDALIGSLGLHQAKRQESRHGRELGIVLAREHWGQGYAKEASQLLLAHAFDALHLPKIFVYHFGSNKRSRRVIESLGFRFNKILPDPVKLGNGQLETSWQYEMSRDQYEAMKTQA